MSRVCLGKRRSYFTCRCLLVAAGRNEECASACDGAAPCAAQSACLIKSLTPTPYRICMGRSSIPLHRFLHVVYYRARYTCAPRSTPPDQCSRWHLAQHELCGGDWAVLEVQQYTSRVAPQTSAASSPLELPVVSKGGLLSAQHNIDHAHGGGSVACMHKCKDAVGQWL